MAHALLGISRTSKRLSAPSLAEQTDDGSVSFATTSMSASSNNNSLSLRHQYSIASTSSTLYTCSEEDEHYYIENDEVGEDAIDDLAVAACEEVIQDSRLNGAGLPVPWQHTQASHAPEASTSASNNSPARKHRERAANHAMRFKRRGGSSRASLTTLGEDWHPRTSSAPELEHSPSKTSLYSLETAPRKTSLPDCTCHLESTDRSEPVEDEDPGGVVLSIDDQLDRMISMTSDLLRVSKGVLASSKRVSVTKASESQIQHSHEHALRQHLESLETQDRFMHFISNEAHAILTTVEGGWSPSSNVHSSLPSSSAPPPSARSHLRPHLRSGSISAPAVRGTTMYVNAVISGSSVALSTSEDASRARRASSTSHATGSSDLGSVKEEEVDAPANASTDDIDAREPTSSTPAHPTKSISRKPSHIISDVSISSSNGLLHASPAVNANPASSAGQTTTATTRAETESNLLSPTLSSATTSSSTPSSSTFFSSFWSRSTNASSSSSNASTPNTTMEASPSLSRFLVRKGASPASAAVSTSSKDARGMLSALAASSPPLPPASAESAAAPPHLNQQDASYEPLPPLSPTVSTGSAHPSSLSHGSQTASHDARPISTSSSTAAVAQLSVVHSSPHLTVSSRPRHRSSLSESLLRASCSGGNLKSDAALAANSTKGNDAGKSHKRARHSTSPAVQFVVKTSDVSTSHKRDKSGRGLDRNSGNQ